MKDLCVLHFVVHLSRLNFLMVIYYFDEKETVIAPCYKKQPCGMLVSPTKMSAYLHQKYQIFPWQVTFLNHLHSMNFDSCLPIDKLMSKKYHMLAKSSQFVVVSSWWTITSRGIEVNDLININFNQLEQRWIDQFGVPDLIRRIGEQSITGYSAMTDSTYIRSQEHAHIYAKSRPTYSDTGIPECIVQYIGVRDGKVRHVVTQILNTWLNC